MATQKEIAETYDYMDEFFRLSLGEHADITAAMYNGDFSMSLDEAQRAKHKYILDGIRFKKGFRILDIGCGWGPMLNAIRKAGGVGLGLTLSPAQAATCKRDGLNAAIADWKRVNKSKLGKFDGVVSVGAFEHFCSIKEYEQGKQEEIYKNFFKLCYDVLPDNGRLFLQTMMWGDKHTEPKDLDVHAKKLSDEWVMGHLGKFYPGSWLPYGLEQIEKCAKPYFKLVSENNGRLDYIQTMDEWGKSIGKFSFRKLFLKFRLLFRALYDKDFRYQLTSLKYSCNQLAFKRKIMSHQRMVFEKR